MGGRPLLTPDEARALRAQSDPFADAPPPAENGEAYDAPRPSRFKLTPFAEIKPTYGRDYLVKGILPRTGLAVLWGKPKCGKSFLATDIMLHVALGWAYQGRRVIQDPVVYLPLEGAESYRKRIEAFRQHHAAALVGKVVPFHIVDAALNLIAEHDELARAIGDALGPIKPAAIVIDTLNRSLAGDENSAEDMAAYVRAADALRDAFGCLVVIVHHCGVDGSRPRGSTALTGAADAQIHVDRDIDKTIRATVEYQKDGEEGAELRARLEVVTIGKNSDGDDVTSCVVVPADSDAPRAPKPKLTPRQQRALDKLREIVAEAGQPAPASRHIPKGVTAVTLDLVTVTLEKTDLVTAVTTQKHRRFVVARTIEQLKDKGAVGSYGELVWLNA